MCNTPFMQLDMDIGWQILHRCSGVAATFVQGFEAARLARRFTDSCCFVSCSAGVASEGAGVATF